MTAPPSAPPRPPAASAESLPSRSVRPYFRFMRYLCRVAFVLYFRGRAFGMRNIPQSGPVVLVCNHQSFFDPISCGVAVSCECDFMARDTLFDHPLFGRIIHSVNAFPVRRGAADIGAVKEMIRRLRRGRVVMIFPEATRSRDGALGRINPNSLLLAKRAAAAIVPVAVDGAFEAWPRNRLFPSPRPTYVTYAPAITAAEVQQWPIERIAQIVTERLVEAQRESQARRRRAHPHN